jgi:hypothetical protein
MSLTSYRAAPPRAKIADVLSCEYCWSAKRPLESGLVLGTRPFCVRRLDLRVHTVGYLLLQNLTDLLSQPVGYLQVQNPTTLPLADLAATYSPAS